MPPTLTYSAPKSRHALPMSNTNTLQIAEFHGDGISAELSAAVHQVASVLPIEIEFLPIDLSLERREQQAERCYQEAEHAIRELGVALKYPTVTATESPNKVLRERLDFSVIHRPVASIPGVATRHDGKVDMHIVRVAVGGTYEDAGRRIGDDVAVSMRVIERRPSREAALFAFRLAERLRCSVTSSSKYTIQRATDGLFEQIIREVSDDFDDVPHRAELFDALLFKVLLNPEHYRVVVTPNEYGDFLSDMACGIVGSIGLGASANYAFDKDGNVKLAMFDPAGGTAPDIAGKGICNPAAALLAFSMLLTHCGRSDLGDALDRAVRSCIAEGQSTRDLGGTLDTNAFVDAVCSRIQSPTPA